MIWWSNDISQCYSGLVSRQSYYFGISASNWELNHLKLVRSCRQLVDIKSYFLRLRDSLKIFHTNWGSKARPNWPRLSRVQAWNTKLSETLVMVSLIQTFFLAQALNSSTIFQKFTSDKNILILKSVLKEI